jgi:hypothetical protein
LQALSVYRLLSLVFQQLLSFKSYNKGNAGMDIAALLGNGKTATNIKTCPKPILFPMEIFASQECLLISSL